MNTKPDAYAAQQETRRRIAAFLRADRDDISAMTSRWAAVVADLVERGEAELDDNGTAAVVADSPELAQANERIAALEGQVDSALKTIIAANETADMLLQQRATLVIERDAALARVAELEAAIDGPEGWRARVHALVAAAQPKPRDESVPPPGWVWLLDKFPGDTSGKVVREEGGRVRSLAEAWKLYNAEHGCAPDDDADAWRQWAVELSQAKGEVSDDALRLAVESCHHAPKLTVEDVDRMTDEEIAQHYSDAGEDLEQVAEDTRAVLFGAVDDAAAREARIRADERAGIDAMLTEIAEWIEYGPHHPNGDEDITPQQYMARRIRQWPREGT